MDFSSSILTGCTLFIVYLLFKRHHNIDWMCSVSINFLNQDAKNKTKRTDAYFNMEQYFKQLARRD